MKNVSFWRTNYDDKQAKIVNEIEIVSQTIGKLDDVIDKMLRIPNMLQMSETSSINTFQWRHLKGIFVYFEPFDQNEVLMINATSKVNDYDLYRFYTMIFEHLGVVMLNANNHKFYTVKEFRETLKD